jgi:hypothetical protein
MSPVPEKWRTVRCGKQGGMVQVRTQGMTARQQRRAAATRRRKARKKTTS